MSLLLAEETFVLFAILALGRALGELNVRRISLGTAGVFFVALVFGHFGRSVPKQVMDLGLLLFVYAVGLQAGPQFFRTFRRRGHQFVIIGVSTALAGALTLLVLAKALNLPFDLASGIYAGAMTCTPALAAAIDAVSRIVPGHEATVSVGYGIAYPLSMVGIVLLVQFLPRLLRRNLPAEEEIWQKQQSLETPTLQVRQFRVTNANCEGKLIRDVNPHRMSRANISRIRHGEEVTPATPDSVIHAGDVLMAVGPKEELEKMRLILGEETNVSMEADSKVVAHDSEFHANRLAGKQLAELRVWERFGVVITRIRRQGVEIAPVGHSTLEIGDTVRIVGERTAVEEFVRTIGGDRRKVDEVNMLPFLAGLLIGIAVGLIPLPIGKGMVIKLGTAGGAFVVSLIIGHFGGLGPLRLYAPPAATNLTRELGLMLFLAGAGTTAGSRLASVMANQGWQLLLVGAAVTIVAVTVALILTLRVYRMHTLAALGASCACMTNPAGLGAAAAQTTTDLPTLAYASVYPVTLIFKIVVAQILVEALHVLG
jgi:putative transport protein